MCRGLFGSRCSTSAFCRTDRRKPLRTTSSFGPKRAARFCSRRLCSATSFAPAWRSSWANLSRLNWACATATRRRNRPLRRCLTQAFLELWLCRSTRKRRRRARARAWRNSSALLARLWPSVPSECDRKCARFRTIGMRRAISMRLRNRCAMRGRMSRVKSSWFPSFPPREVSGGRRHLSRIDQGYGRGAGVQVGHCSRRCGAHLPIAL